jgi:hypothetical protein
MNTLRLKSSNSDVAIEFSNVDVDYFSVAVVAHDQSASRRVYAYTDAQGIAQLFAEAARDWKGWEGQKVWESLEGEFRMELTMDRLGQVALRVRIRSGPGGPDPWEHTAELAMEAGQLEAIARDARRLWSDGG